MLLQIIFGTPMPFVIPMIPPTYLANYKRDTFKVFSIKWPLIFEFDLTMVSFLSLVEKTSFAAVFCSYYAAVLAPSISDSSRWPIINVVV